MNPKNGSVSNEPAFQDRGFAPDPSETRAGLLSHREEVDAARDCIHQEPHYAGSVESDSFRTWLDDRKAGCSWLGNAWATILAGLIGGPFALVGALFSGRQTLSGILYIILFGPVLEEMLKQSGMIYLVERKPYRVTSSWQFFVAAAISALIFSSVENLMYVRQFAESAAAADPTRLARFASFRWTVCTALHLCCSLIAAVGVRKVWKQQLATGRPADLVTAFPLIVTAIVVHGVYNTFAMIFSDIF